MTLFSVLGQGSCSKQASAATKGLEEKAIRLTESDVEFIHNNPYMEISDKRIN